MSISGKQLQMSTVTQLIKYGVVGVLNNFLGYLIYLLVTWLWLDPKMAVSLLYPIGATTAYFGHAKYSFSYGGKASRGVLRFVIAQLVGYSLNLLLLYVFSDILKIPHQIVQAVAIVVVAGVLFLLFKYYVFPDRSTN